MHCAGSDVEAKLSASKGKLELPHLQNCTMPTVTIHVTTSVYCKRVIVLQTYIVRYNS